MNGTYYQNPTFPTIDNTDPSLNILAHPSHF